MENRLDEYLKANRGPMDIEASSGDMRRIRIKQTSEILTCPRNDNPIDRIFE
jgi:hypothetical protein